MSAQVFVLSIIGLAVGLPVTLAMVAEIAKRQIKFKERKLELMADMTAEKAAQYAAHVERLEQRMRVLERIATDKGVNRAAQIETLRDDPVIAQIADEELH
jgi:ABC-type lipoprotein release transport system permease subunit